MSRGQYKVVKQIVESTDATQAAIPHQKAWVRYRKSREMEGDHTFIFTDGSSLGSYGAVLVGPSGIKRLAGATAPTSTRNVGAELNGAILGLEAVEPGTSVVLVFDYMGVGAWLTGNWKMKDPEVMEKVDRMVKAIREKKLTMHYIHHRGHQSDRSTFTRWNAEADKLATEGLDAVDKIAELNEAEG